MDALELKEFLLANGKFQWRAIGNKGYVVMVADSRLELVRELRRRLR